MSGRAEDLCYMPAAEMAALVRTRHLSPVEIVTAILDRIEATAPRVNAFATLTAERALADARDAEAAVMAGAELGPLHGVPVTIKDLSHAEGAPTERGSFACKGVIATEDAPLTARLRAAGAIVLGKTTTSEFGWTGVSRSPLTGITHNPWRHGLNAGASSAGAAAAACAGYGPLHHGSDGAGSIRMPAHFCGVFGHKPTHGRVPHVPPSNNDAMTHHGPITRTVGDAALMLQVMAGADPLDQTSSEAAPLPYAALLETGSSLAGKRIAFSPDLGHASVDPEIASLVADAVAVYESMGAHVEQVTPPWGKLGPDLARFFWPAHMTAYAHFLPEWEARMDPGLVACIREGARHSVTDYLEHRERKLNYAVEVARWFQNWDLLLTPAVSVAAFPAELLQPPHWRQHPWDWMSWAEFSYPFNIAHNPACSIPCGFTSDVLPVGLQIVGRRFDDLGVLQAARAFEQARPWADRRPVIGAE